MADLARDVNFLAGLPSDERVRALERIIPPHAVQEVLEQTGHASRHYSVLPAWFVVWFVIALGLFSRDSYRHVLFNHGIPEP